MASTQLVEAIFTQPATKSINCLPNSNDPGGGMIQKIYSGFKKVCPLRRLALIGFVLLISPLLAHAEKNDLLLLPATISKKAPSSLLLDIAKAGKRLVAVGERGHIIYSDDKGLSWQQVDSPTSVTLTAVYFPTPEKGWAVGHDGVVLHTDDGGLTWGMQLNGFEEIKLNLTHAKMLLSAKETEFVDATAEAKEALSGELKELKYQCESMEADYKGGVCCDPLLDVWFKDEEEGFVIGAYGLFFHTSDGGVNWTPWWDRVNNPDKLHLNAIAATDDILYIAGESGILFRSLDDGKSWESLESPYGGSFLGIVASQNDNFVIAFGIGGKMVYSVDRGKSWKLIQTRAGAALSGGIVQENGHALIVSYSGVIMVGPDRSGSFTPKRAGGVGWNAVVDVGDSHIVLVGLRGVKRIPFDSINSGG